MFRTTLFELKTDDIKVSVEAYFNEKGDLVVEGYDIGKSVEEFWGDSDYEYSTTIPANEVGKLFDYAGIMPGETQDLLTWIQMNYNDYKCFSDFRNLLTTLGINFTSFSWT